MDFFETQCTLRGDSFANATEPQGSLPVTYRFTCLTTGYPSTCLSRGVWCNAGCNVLLCSEKTSLHLLLAAPTTAAASVRRLKLREKRRCQIINHLMTMKSLLGLTHSEKKLDSVKRWIVVSQWHRKCHVLWAAACACGAMRRDVRLTSVASRV